MQLVVALRGAGVFIEDPQIIARTGWTTEELSAAIEAARPAGPFGLVSLLIGVNNQFRGRTVEAFAGPFLTALDHAIGCAGNVASHVLVLSIPDWGATPYAAGRDRYRVAMEIDAFNAVSRAHAQAAGARYIDVTTQSREAAADPTLLVADGLHPSARMYAEWVRLTLAEALQILGET
jgi:lysophospholipase L1-like esterase